jgi:hypothetical protein
VFRPIENLLNLSKLSLEIRQNKIGDIGAYALFYPLSNLQSLSSLRLILDENFEDKQTEHLFKHYLNK